jgi:hypothetical protein
MVIARPPRAVLHTCFGSHVQERLVHIVEDRRSKRVITIHLQLELRFRYKNQSLQKVVDLIHMPE